MEVTNKQIKELRERSGVGIGKCKEALVEAEGDMEKAIAILRKKGLASAVKKEGRKTQEGCISTFETDDLIAVVELKAETDFVVKNERFQKFSKDLAEQATKSKTNNLEDFLKESFFVDPSVNVDEYRNLLIQATGENIQISKLELIHKKQDASYGIYSHMGGKIVSVVELANDANVKDIAYDIAMQVAAEDPQYLNPEKVPEEVKRQEEEIARSQIKNKPAFVVEKIIKGKVENFLKQNCLVLQSFIKDSSLTIEKYLEKQSKELGKDLYVRCFWRFKVGEE